MSFTPSRRNLIKGAGALGLAGALSGHTAQAATAATTTKPTTIKRITSGSLTYDRITCDPFALEKIQSTNFDWAKFQGKPQTLEDRAKVGGYTALINCDSWANIDGTTNYDVNKIGRPVSMQLYGGKLYQSFGRTISDYGPESNTLVLCMKKDGKFGHANNTPGRTDAEWQKYLTDNGAIWSAGYGPNLVVWGKKVTDFSAFPHFLYVHPDTKDGIRVSARTCLGQKPDGTVVIVVVDGRTDHRGANMYDCANIMVAEGCENAVVLDGGGSSQIWWNGKYVHQSSDLESKMPPRSLGGGFLALKGTLPAYS